MQLGMIGLGRMGGSMVRRDVGTSGGVAGEERGYCLMIGGEVAIVSHLRPVFSALAPGSGTVARTPARSGATEGADAFAASWHVLLARIDEKSAGLAGTGA